VVVKFAEKLKGVGYWAVPASLFLILLANEEKSLLDVEIRLRADLEERYTQFLGLRLSLID
jgi:hypothetical protein